MDGDLSVRESIEAAMETHGAPDAAPGAPSAPAAAPAPAAPAPTSSTDGGEPAAPGAAPDPTRAPPTVAGTPAAPPELRAPASWKADLREHWKALPPDIQGEIVRRERENDARMQEAASVRKFQERFERVIEPYQALIEADGGSPLAAFNDYLRTATLLRTGPPQEKARMVAQLVSQFQVPLEALDHFLAQAIRGGAQIPPAQAQQNLMPQQMQPQEFRDPRLDQLLAQMAERERVDMTGSIESFRADPKHEFFDDVRLTMADVMDAAAKRGVQMGLEDAYVRACQIEPEVRKVLEQRSAAGNASQAARTLARARHAASSVPSQLAPPAPRTVNGAAGPATVRSSILEAIDSLSGGA